MNEIKDSEEERERKKRRGAKKRKKVMQLLHLCLLKKIIFYSILFNIWIPSSYWYRYRTTIERRRN